MKLTAEHQRLEAYRQRRTNWKNWGPYLSERAWGTVREDYSSDGLAWEYFPHDHARSRAYRWSEDGIAGICDRFQYVCFALALWNGRDPILKERMFGLSGPEGNHGEDVKEYYFYLDSTPTHSYLRMLYKYPQAEFPYADLVAENRKRSSRDFEYELMDTGVFKGNRYFDVQVEYAKAGPDDILSRITVANRGPEESACHLLPTLWFRNTWSWGYEKGPMGDVLQKPFMKQIVPPQGSSAIRADHSAAGTYYLYAVRHHVHAGQVGVSLVCLLGSGLPLYPAHVSGSRLRKAPAGAARPRVVHAPQRPAAGLRMEFQRRQSAGACLGDLPSLQDRREAARQSGSGVP